MTRALGYGPEGCIVEILTTQGWPYSGRGRQPIQTLVCPSLGIYPKVGTVLTLACPSLGIYPKLGTALSYTDLTDEGGNQNACG